MLSSVLLLQVGEVEARPLGAEGSCKSIAVATHSQIEHDAGCVFDVCGLLILDSSGISTNSLW